MANDFIGVLELLIDHNVEFILVGGLAASAYGSPQVTQDVDICIDLSLKNIVRLKKAMAAIKPVHRMHPSKPPFNDEPSRLETFRNIYLSTEYGQIDCLGEIMGIGSFKETLESSTELEIRGKKCRIITLEALIKSKEALGRPKDKEAVVILKALLEKTAKSRIS